MKIFYVEDELVSNVSRIMRLFSEYIDKEAIARLEAIENDASGYGVEPEEIKCILEKTGMIDVEYRFPDALKRIIKNYHRYRLFIIDRNLSGHEYTLQEIQQIDMAYDEQCAERYAEREGDYLYLKIGQCTHGKGLDNIYFLTAYPAQDELRCAQEIAAFIEKERWRTRIKNFIEKGNSQEFKTLHDEIINFKTIHPK